MCAYLHIKAMTGRGRCVSTCTQCAYVCVYTFFFHAYVSLYMQASLMCMYVCVYAVMVVLVDFSRGLCAWIYLLTVW